MIRENLMRGDAQSPDIRSCFAPRRGLSLLETLVAITTLAVAAALFVPAAGRNRSQSILTDEQGNLRILAQLMAKYSSEDVDGILGPVHPLYLTFFFEGYADYGGGPGTMSFLNWGDSFSPETRAFNHLLYGRQFVNNTTEPGDRAYFKPFQCLGRDLGWQAWPGFSGGQTQTNAPYFQTNGTSFRLNNLQISIGQSVRSYGVYGRPADRVPAPSQTLAFFEARAFQTLWTNELWGSAEHGTLEGYHGRKGFFNVAYVDGHMAYADFGVGTFYPRLPEHQLLNIRGTWGRMDCLPESGIFVTPPPVAPAPGEDGADDMIPSSPVMQRADP